MPQRREDTKTSKGSGKAGEKGSFGPLCLGGDFRLKAPPEYWALTDDEREAIGNGCGPKGAGFLVPDTVWGLSVREA